MVICAKHLFYKPFGVNNKNRWTARNEKKIMRKYIHALAKRVDEKKNLFLWNKTNISVFLDGGYVGDSQI